MGEDVAIHSRRYLIRLLGTSGIGTLAGCGEQISTDSPTNTPSATDTKQDTSGETETETPNPPDSDPPILEGFAAETVDESASIGWNVSNIVDNREIDEVVVETPKTQVTLENLETPKQGRLEALPGEQNTVTIEVKDRAKNSTTDSDQAYSRMYDVFENPELNLGAVYIPFAGDKFGKCYSTSRFVPSVGVYGDPIPAEISTKHIDQMQSAGISRVMFNFGEEDEDYQRARKFVQETELTDEVEFECFYVIHQALRRNRDLSKDFEFVRDDMYSHPNYATIDNRPVVTFWWMKTALIQDEARSTIESQYGGFPEFVEFLQNELSDSGTDPFLIADFDDMAYNGYWDGFRDEIELFDGVTNATGGNFGKDARHEWTDRLARMENIYSHNADLADRLDIDFIPVVFPGFDDRHNECWGLNRVVPREPSHLRDLLRLANTYRTRNRINIHTWNGWPEGHLIEPGSFRDNHYGTDYLKALREFQNG